MTGETLIAIEITFTAPTATDEQFEEFLDAVQAQLEAIGCECQMAARLADRHAEFATTEPTDDFQGAAAEFLTSIRTALHAAGAATPGWPRFKPTNHTVRELAFA